MSNQTQQPNGKPRSEAHVQRVKVTENDLLILTLTVGSSLLPGKRDMAIRQLSSLAQELQCAAIVVPEEIGKLHVMSSMDDEQLASFGLMRIPDDGTEGDDDGNGDGKGS